MHTRGFFDSNNDGTGDIRGLTEKLDYLEWLGVDCLWLLPFYQSPLRDGGYDVSDFFTILPESGTLGDAALVMSSNPAANWNTIMQSHPWSSINGAGGAPPTAPGPARDLAGAILAAVLPGCAPGVPVGVPDPPAIARTVRPSQTVTGGSSGSSSGCSAGPSRSRACAVAGPSGRASR